MIFYVHGLHKVVEGIAYLRGGAPWKLAEEVAELHIPAPVAGAFAATLVQVVSALMLAMGLFTRLNALLLTATFAVAVLQNLCAGRDPELALLYLLVVMTMSFLGGGKYSLDALLLSRSQRI